MVAQLPTDLHSQLGHSRSRFGIHLVRSSLGRRLSTSSAQRLHGGHRILRWLKHGSLPRLKLPRFRGHPHSRNGVPDDRMKKERRSKYPPEYKRWLVDLVRARRTASSLAAEYGVSY